MSNFADEDRRVRGRRTIRGMPEDDIPERVTALEAEMGRMREELTTVRADAAAARVLAGGADHDVSEVRGELRAHTRAIGALHEDQVALRQEMRRGFAQVDSASPRSIRTSPRSTATSPRSSDSSPPCGRACSRSSA